MWQVTPRTVESPKICAWCAFAKVASVLILRQVDGGLEMELGLATVYLYHSPASSPRSVARGVALDPAVDCRLYLVFRNYVRLRISHASPQSVPAGMRFPLISVLAAEQGF